MIPQAAFLSPSASSLSESLAAVRGIQLAGDGVMKPVGRDAREPALRFSIDQRSNAGSEKWEHRWTGGRMRDGGAWCGQTGVCVCGQTGGTLSQELRERGGGRGELERESESE